MVGVGSIYFIKKNVKANLGNEFDRSMRQTKHRTKEELSFRWAESILQTPTVVSILGEELQFYVVLKPRQSLSYRSTLVLEKKQHKDKNETTSFIYGENSHQAETSIQALERDVILDANLSIQNPSERRESLPAKKIARKEEKTPSTQAIEALSITNPNLKISAKAALLMEYGSNEVLYHKNSLKKIHPASTTKLMTAMVALDYCKGKEKVKVGNEIHMIASDSSRAYLKRGQVLTIAMLLDAMLLPSGNDAAYVTAVHVGRVIAKDSSLTDKKAVKVFVSAMNEKVEELELVDTRFKTPDGYDAKGQYTTAYDMGLIANKALEYPEIYKTVQKVKARDILISGEDVTWYSTNKLIKSGSGYYYPYAIGLKTGTSGLGGRCLVSAAKYKKKKYVSVVMDATLIGRWEDSIQLLDYAVQKQKKE